MRKSIVGAIFARGGSKSVPRKNLQLLAGKPLIAYSIEVAKKVKQIERVIVSTDDEEIAMVALDNGAEVPFMRPVQLAGDEAPEWLAWQHAIRTISDMSGPNSMDIMISVPTSSPLRSVEDVEACVTVLLESDADVVITVTPTSRSPYFNMVTLRDGYAGLVIPPA